MASARRIETGAEECMLVLEMIVVQLGSGHVKEEEASLK